MEDQDGPSLVVDLEGGATTNEVARRTTRANIPPREGVWTNYLVMKARVAFY